MDDLETIEGARRYLEEWMRPSNEGERKQRVLTGRGRVAVETILRRLDELERERYGR